MCTCLETTGEGSPPDLKVTLLFKESEVVNGRLEAGHLKRIRAFCEQWLTQYVNYYKILRLIVSADTGCALKYCLVVTFHMF